MFCTRFSPPVAVRPQLAEGTVLVQIATARDRHPRQRSLYSGALQPIHHWCREHPTADLRTTLLSGCGPSHGRLYGRHGGPRSRWTSRHRPRAPLEHGHGRGSRRLTWNGGTGDRPGRCQPQNAQPARRQGRALGRRRVLRRRQPRRPSRRPLGHEERGVGADRNRTRARRYPQPGRPRGRLSRPPGSQPRPREGRNHDSSASDDDQRSGMGRVGRIRIVQRLDSFPRPPRLPSRQALRGRSPGGSSTTTRPPFTSWE